MAALHGLVASAGQGDLHDATCRPAAILVSGPGDSTTIGGARCPHAAHAGPARGAAGRSRQSADPGSGRRNQVGKHERFFRDRLGGRSSSRTGDSSSGRATKELLITKYSGRKRSPSPGSRTPVCERGRAKDFSAKHAWSAACMALVPATGDQLGFRSSDALPRTTRSLAARTGWACSSRLDGSVTRCRRAGVACLGRAGLDLVARCR